jgi:hypothetical protein
MFRWLLDLLRWLWIFLNRRKQILTAKSIRAAVK